MCRQQPDDDDRYQKCAEINEIKPNNDDDDNSNNNGGNDVDANATPKLMMVTTRSKKKRRKAEAETLGSSLHHLSLSLFISMRMCE